MINHYIYLDKKIKLTYIGSYNGVPIYLSEDNVFVIEHKELFSKKVVFAKSENLEGIIKIIKRLV